MSKYYPPMYKEEQFHCPYCRVYASQSWQTLRKAGGYASPIEASCCSHCHGYSFWHDEVMVIPSDVPVAPSHVDLPEECLEDYNEARDIVARSPRAAAALIRLAIQKLMPVLSEKGKNINADIASLVEKGLPEEIQQALDFCRVVGNNAVHPGEIDLNDTPEVAHSLFEMINFIVEDQISRPKRVATLYDKLPQTARDAINERDSQTSGAA